MQLRAQRQALALRFGRRRRRRVEQRAASLDLALRRGRIALALAAFGLEGGVDARVFVGHRR